MGSYSHLEHRGTFECVGSNGKKYVVELHVEVHVESVPGGPVRRDGLGRLTYNGRLVDYVAKGRYRTSTGVDLTAENPNAP